MLMLKEQSFMLRLNGTIWKRYVIFLLGGGFSEIKIKYDASRLSLSLSFCSNKNNDHNNALYDTYYYRFS